MDQDLVVGRLIREYSDNQRKLVCIRRELRSASSSLSTITPLLANRPESIRIVDGGLCTGESLQSSIVPTDIIATTRDLLAELSDAAQDRERMESDLRDLGLDWVVRSNNSRGQEDHEPRAT
jgi:hypothetical protein